MQYHTPCRLQVRAQKWRVARNKSDELLHFIAMASGSATLEDVRRWDLDGWERVCAGESHPNRYHAPSATL